MLIFWLYGVVFKVAPCTLLTVLSSLLIRAMRRRADRRRTSLGLVGRRQQPGLLASSQVAASLSFVGRCREAGKLRPRLCLVQAVDQKSCPGRYGLRSFRKFLLHVQDCEDQPWTRRPSSQDVDVVVERRLRPSHDVCDRRTTSATVSRRLRPSHDVCDRRMTSATVARR